MSVKLKAISIAGWKTIQNLGRFEPRPLNVLIGTNAAGKSNFIGFFRFLQWMLTRPGQLQLHIKENGGANSLLHYGSERTQQINAGRDFCRTLLAPHLGGRNVNFSARVIGKPGHKGGVPNWE